MQKALVISEVVASQRHSLASCDSRFGTASSFGSLDVLLGAAIWKLSLLKCRLLYLHFECNQANEAQAHLQVAMLLGGCSWRTGFHVFFRATFWQHEGL